MRAPRLNRNACRALFALAAIALAASAWAVDPTSPRVQARGQGDRSGRQVSLYDQLRVGLKAYTEGDLAFIATVVAKVEDGTLPRRMVDATFLWARNRYKSKPAKQRLRPIVYFQPALTTQAKKIGVEL